MEHFRALQELKLGAPVERVRVSGLPELDPVEAEGKPWSKPFNFVGTWVEMRAILRLLWTVCCSCSITELCWSNPSAIQSCPAMKCWETSLCALCKTQHFWGKIISAFSLQYCPVTTPAQHRDFLAKPTGSSLTNEETANAANTSVQFLSCYCVFPVTWVMPLGHPLGSSMEFCTCSSAQL